jgi:copper(I)-binding protein
MKHHASTLAGIALGLASLVAQAHEYKLGGLTIEHPWARPTGAGQATGGAYMKIVNGGGDDKLLSVSSDAAKSVELHEMKMEGDVMKMRQVDGIALKAGQSVELKPGGYHVMFVGLKAPLKAGGYHVMLVGLKAPLKVGDKIPAKLKFERAGEVDVTLNVDAAGAAAPEHKH